MKYLDLKAINKPYEHAADEVLRSGWYLKGDGTRRFEQAYAEYIGSKYCIGCALTNPHLRRNNLKEKLHRIERLKVQ